MDGINIVINMQKTTEEWNEAIKWHEMAWSGVLESLKSALEKGEGQ